MIRVFLYVRLILPFVRFVPFDLLILQLSWADKRQAAIHSWTLNRCEPRMINKTYTLFTSIWMDYKPRTTNSRIPCSRAVWEIIVPTYLFCFKWFIIIILRIIVVRRCTDLGPQTAKKKDSIVLVRVPANLTDEWWTS